jgi:hypothetical protein
VGTRHGSQDSYEAAQTGCRGKGVDEELQARIAGREFGSNSRPNDDKQEQRSAQEFRSQFS